MAMDLHSSLAALDVNDSSPIATLDPALDPTTTTASTTTTDKATTTTTTTTTTCTMTHKTPPLPRDIQLYILDILINDYHDTEDETPTHAHTLLPLLLVCKSWNSYARRQIYKRIYFGRAYFYFKFAKHLESENGKQLRKLVKQVVIELNESEDCDEVLLSNVIHTIFKLCRRIRTVELRCLWVDASETTPWNDRVANAMKVYANPTRFIFNHPASSSFDYTNGLLGVNILTYMPNLQRLDLYIDPNSGSLARELAKIEVPYMNIRVVLHTDDDGDVEYTPTSDLASTNPEDQILRPVDFFKIVSTNPHLRRLEIVNRQDPRRAEFLGTESPAEEAISKWITERKKAIEFVEDGDNSPENVLLHITIHREYPGVKKMVEGYQRMYKKLDKTEVAARKKLLDEYKTTYTLPSQHESDEDPSDSEWEQDTRIPISKKRSNRETLPPQSENGDEVVG